jgi:hypothetical protein
MSSWTRFRDAITKPFKKVGEVVKDIYDGIGDFAESLGHEVERVAKDIYKPISIINPLLGAGLGVISEGSDGLKSALKVGLTSNVLLGKNLANLSASGRGAEAKAIFKKTIDNPNKVLENTLKNGGDIEKGLLDTAIQVSGNVPKALQTAIKKDFGGVQLGHLVEGIDLKDPVKMAALYEYIKNEPPELLTVPELELISNPDVLERISMFKEELDTATQARLDIVQQRMSSRGIRGSMIEEQESQIYESRDQQLAKYELRMREMALQYNNAQKTHQFAMHTQNYALQLKAQQDKAKALANILGTKAGSDIAGQSDGIIEGVLDSLGILKRNKDTGRAQVDTGGGIDIDLDDMNFVLDDIEFGNPKKYDMYDDLDIGDFELERPSILDLGTRSDTTSSFHSKKYEPFKSFNS